MVYDRPAIVVRNWVKNDGVFKSLVFMAVINYEPTSNSIKSSLRNEVSLDQYLVS